MQKLNLKLKQSANTGIFHDSRADSKLLMKSINLIVDKLNEVIEENNKLKEIIKQNNNGLQTKS